MYVLMILSFLLVVFLIVLVMLRLFGQGGIQRLTPSEMVAGSAMIVGGRFVSDNDNLYQQVLDLAGLHLEPDEIPLAACGQRGEIEKVLLATNQRLFFCSRRYNDSSYHYEAFNYLKAHPIPMGQAVINETVRVLEGERLAEMTSPGAESWLDTSEHTLKVINEQIKKARIAAAQQG
jgi:hypothetical protein